MGGSGRGWDVEPVSAALSAIGGGELLGYCWDINEHYGALPF